MRATKGPRPGRATCSPEKISPSFIIKNTWAEVFPPGVCPERKHRPVYSKTAAVSLSYAGLCLGSRNTPVGKTSLVFLIIKNGLFFDRRANGDLPVRTQRRGSCMDTIDKVADSARRRRAVLAPANGYR